MRAHATQLAPRAAPEAGALRGAAARDLAIATVLIVDPDPATLGSAAVHMLRQNGIAVDQIGPQALKELAAFPGVYDLVILELNADGIDGAETCRAIIEGQEAPVLIWSRRASALDQVAGLELGADDYVAKTAHPLELLARCRAILRRARAAAASAASPFQRAAPYSWTFEPQARGVRSWKGGRVWLRPTWTTLLSAFCERPREVIGREELTARLDREQGEISDRTIDVFVSRLRQTLDRCDGAGRLIRTQHFRGYFLNASVRPCEDGLLIRGEAPAEGEAVAGRAARGERPG